MALVTACGPGTYDTVDYENPARDALTDDAAPPRSEYDASLTFTNRAGLSVNNSTARYRFDVASFRDESEQKDARRLFPSHGAYLAEHGAAIPSVQTIGTYVKQLDDTIYAGVERSVQDGIAPTIAPKRTILAESLAALVAHRSAGDDEAAVYAAAALRLGGVAAAVPADLEARTKVAMDKFASDALKSKPIGFYTWSDELRAIWTQDRFLQQELPSTAAACALAEAIDADPSRRARYDALLALYARLTNPLESSLSAHIAAGDQCAALGRPAAFLSASRTSEVELFEKLYPAGVPENADLMQDLIDAIREGKIDLAPKPDDGWYQHQQFALETLLVTDKSEERSKIGFTGAYKKRLQEAFETMLVQHRETHVKQTGSARFASEEMPPDNPEFRLEPLATVYVRHARSYVFLEAALDEAYGAALLDSGVTVTADGPQEETLRDSIRRARDLFYGLYLVSSFDIGMKPKLDATGDPAPTTWATLTSSADQWLQNIASDPIASADVRVMVPIASLADGRARYWAVIGVRTTLAGYSYIHGDDMLAPQKAEDETRVPLPTEQFLEVTSSGAPLTRDEFRSLCDANPTAEAIQAALEAR